MMNIPKNHTTTVTFIAAPATTNYALFYSRTENAS